MSLGYLVYPNVVCYIIIRSVGKARMFRKNNGFVNKLNRYRALINKTQPNSKVKNPKIIQSDFEIRALYTPLIIITYYLN